MAGRIRITFYLILTIVTASYVGVVQAIYGSCDSIEQDLKFEKTLREKCNKDLEEANQKASEVNDLQRHYGDCKSNVNRLKSDVQQLMKDKEYARGEAQDYENLLNQEKAESMKKDKRFKTCNDQLQETQNKLTECEDKLIDCGDSAQADRHIEFLKVQIGDLKNQRERLLVEAQEAHNTMRDLRNSESKWRLNSSESYKQIVECKNKVETLLEERKRLGDGSQGTCEPCPVVETCQDTKKTPIGDDGPPSYFTQTHLVFAAVVVLLCVVIQRQRERILQLEKDLEQANEKKKTSEQQITDLKSDKQDLRQTLSHLTRHVGRKAHGDPALISADEEDDDVDINEMTESEQDKLNAPANAHGVTVNHDGSQQNTSHQNPKGDGGQELANGQRSVVENETRDQDQNYQQILNSVTEIESRVAGVEESIKHVLQDIANLGHDVKILKEGVQKIEKKGRPLVADQGHDVKILKEGVQKIEKKGPTLVAGQGSDIQAAVGIDKRDGTGDAVDAGGETGAKDGAMVGRVQVDQGRASKPDVNVNDDGTSRNAAPRKVQRVGEGEKAEGGPDVASRGPGRPTVGLISSSKGGVVEGAGPSGHDGGSQSHTAPAQESPHESDSQSVTAVVTGDNEPSQSGSTDVSEHGSTESQPEEDKMEQKEERSPEKDNNEEEPSL